MKRAGEWSLEVLVGQGGGADVYRARHLRTGALCALKQLRDSHPVALERTLREARVQAAVRHPHVLGVHDVLEVEGSTCLLLEWVAGPSLAEWLRGRTVSVSEALSLFAGVVAGVGAAHKLGLIHRDLKPSNVMLAPDGAGGWTPKVCDFGLVKEQGLPGDTRTGIAMGTPAYMAPEQIRSARRADQRADIFSLGVILYELLCGRPPFVGDDLLKSLRARLDADYPAPRTLRQDIPDSVNDALLACLEPAPGDRPRSCEALSARLRGETEPAPVAAPPTRGNLEEAAAGLIGRGFELARLSVLLEHERRLVLVGPPGVGKTRLAMEVARRNPRRQLGGVWRCSLRGARGTIDVLKVIARAVGGSLREATEEKLIARLGWILQAKGQALLLLDGAEGCAEALQALLERWVEDAPMLRFLVTSRCSLPGVNTEVTLAPLSTSEGIELLSVRARVLQPEFGTSDAEQPILVAIVEQLDCLPLAIELAAGRARVMSPADLLRRLGERFRLLRARGAGGITLQGALDESWALLSARERAGLAQCSIFRAGFTAAAARDVVTLRSEEGAQTVSDVLDALSRYNLLQGLGGRLKLLESVREYAEERLQERDVDVELLASRYSLHYAALGADAALEALDGPDGVACRRVLSLELANLTHAHELSSRRGEVAVAFRCAAALSNELYLTGPLAAALTVVERTLLLPLSLGQRARLLEMAAIHFWASGDTDAAWERAKESVAAAREIGDQRCEGMVMNTLGTLHQGAGDAQEARRCFEAALDIYRRIGLRRLEGGALSNLGLWFSQQGQLEEALRCYREALVIHREVGNRKHEGGELDNLGTLYRKLGRLEDAMRSFEAALLMHREIGARMSEGVTLSNMGAVLKDQDRLPESRNLMERALLIHREAGARHFESIGQANLALHDEDDGDHEGALRRFQEAIALQREVGSLRTVGLLLFHFAAMCRRRGAFDLARGSLEEAETILQDFGDQRGLARAREALEALNALVAEE